MKNILGTQEDLKPYNKSGNLVFKDSSGYSYEYTRDENGNDLTFKDSDGYSYEYTYDENGNELTYKNSDGYSHEYTYDENGKVLTYKDSDGEERGFDIPEFTIEQLIEKVGNFKLIK